MVGGPPHGRLLTDAAEWIDRLTMSIRPPAPECPPRAASLAALRSAATNGAAVVADTVVAGPAKPALCAHISRETSGLEAAWRCVMGSFEDRRDFIQLEPGVFSAPSPPRAADRPEQMGGVLFTAASQLIRESRSVVTDRRHNNPS